MNFAEEIEMKSPIFENNDYSFKNLSNHVVIIFFEKLLVLFIAGEDVEHFSIYLTLTIEF